MRRVATKGTKVLIDFAALSLAYWLAFLFRFEFDVGHEHTKLLFFTWPYVVVLQYLALALLGVPAMVWRFVGMAAAKRIVAGLGLAFALLVVLRLVAPTIGGYAKFITIPLGVLTMNLVLAVATVLGARCVRRMLGERGERSSHKEANGSRKRTLLIGAGRAGVLVAKEIDGWPGLGIVPVGFIDDDQLKVGGVIEGLKVLGTTEQLAELAGKHRVEQVIITIAAAKPQDIRRIRDVCAEAGLPTKIIPGVYEILDGRVNLSRIRDVSIEDLLGRDAVQLDTEAIEKFLTGKRVLVTGAGGSIGSELCRNVARYAPERLVLVERAENALFQIHQELLRTFPEVQTQPCICDVTDGPRVEEVWSEHQPEVVFHAAAHKHVPMMEWNPGEAVKNNVFGTKMVADASERHGSTAFVMISTDKAVNPTSVMGATKQAAESYIQQLSRTAATKFVAVRFGNVLGSAGSVIPTFKEQIRRGGPVTVTHPDMVRFFMTIPEACQLVMEAATMGEGGEVFVLDMGEPVKIVDLARDMIRLSGFAEDEMDIVFTGIRPGEKMYEELATAEDGLQPTANPKIMMSCAAKRSPEAFLQWNMLDPAAGLEFVRRSMVREGEAAN